MSLSLYRIHSQLSSIENAKIEISKAMQECDGRGAAIEILQNELTRLDNVLKAAYAVEIPNEIADKIKIW